MPEYIELTADQVVEKYADTVYRLAYAKTLSRQDADDVFQEVFLRYVRKAPSFESEEHRKAWLIRVTLNCAKNALTHSSRTELSIDDTELPTDGGYDGLDEAEAVRTAMGSLPEKYRDALYLFYCEELSVAEVAKALGTTQGNVKVRLNRGREMLKGLLEKGA